MKKLILALTGALIVGFGVFAENNTKGIDILCAFTLGHNKINYSVVSGSDKADCTYRLTEIGISPLVPNKISTYDCFLANDHIGIYASFGYNLMFGLDKAEVSVFGRSEVKDGDGWVGLAAEFIIGPAFGFDLGSTRFNLGAGLHFLGGALWTTKEIKVTESGGGTSYSYSQDDTRKMKYSALGLALAPQFRFTADRRCSFILGCDVVFDFKVDMSVDGKKIPSPDSTFRFAATPYLGLGINF